MFWEYYGALRARSASVFKIKSSGDICSQVLSFDKGKGSEVWKEASKWQIVLHVGKGKQWERILC